MSDGRQELGCANCGKVGSLGEEVELESTGWRSAKCYIGSDGKVEVKHGLVDDNGGTPEVTGTDGIECSACGALFSSWEEATAANPVEYRCSVCDWWGLQDWLHDPDCPGELTELKVPCLPVAA